MDKRLTSYRALYVAIGASAIVSITLATATTANVIRNRYLHRAAPTVMGEDQSGQEKAEREAAAAKEKAERQRTFDLLKLHELRQGE